MENTDRQENLPSMDQDTAVSPPGKVPKAGWLGLLTVYLILFVTIGYLAFLDQPPNLALESYEKMATLEDEATRSFFVDVLKQESSEHSKQQEFVTQSFNVVLGALLGFLSASATAVLKRRDES